MTGPIFFENDEQSQFFQGGGTSITPTPQPTPIVIPCIGEGGPCGGIIIGECCSGLNCDGGDSENIGVCTRRTPLPTPTATTANICGNDGQFGTCPTGFSCQSVSFNTGTQVDIIFSCVQDETPPPPTATVTEVPPICQPGTFQCGPTVAISPTETATTCCVDSDVCCPDGSGGFVCRPGPTCPTADSCPPTGTLASCIDTSGRALLYTGQKDSNGVCTTQESNNLECLQCPPRGQFVECLQGGVGSYSSGKIEGLAICPTYQVQNDPVCLPPPPVTCTPPDGPFEQIISSPCSAANPAVYIGGNYTVVQSRTYTETEGPGVCPYTPWTNVSTDFSTCIPRDIVPDGCTPPSDGFNRQVQVACTSLGSEFIGGIAIQAQVRSYDPSGPTGTICRYTQWINSGIPDTSTCQLEFATTTTTTQPNPPAPIACTAPAGPFTEVSSIPCSQIDGKYTSGNATIQRVRRYDSSAQGPGLCPYTEWETTGTPNITLCREPVFWRNCVTGQLVEGNPPTTYIQSNFPQGGTCWEPQTDLGFIPSLSEALRYTYQRGSTKLPEPKSIKITNPSATIAYTVKIATNQNITLSTDKNQSGKGSISFTIGPRSEIRLTVTVTQELLQQLQDGMSTLSVNLEYDRVLQ